MGGVRTWKWKTSGQLDIEKLCQFTFQRIESNPNRHYEKRDAEEKISLYVPILNALEGVGSEDHHGNFMEKNMKRYALTRCSMTTR